MKDLTNNEINDLVNKYNILLDVIGKESNLPKQLYVIDFSRNYVKHKQIPTDWKIFTLILIRKLFVYYNLKNEDEIKTIIDEFVDYYNDNYQEYINSLDLVSDDFSRDYHFIFRFILKKYGEN